MSLGSVFLRVILLIMVFLLGFMCCIGAIVGAGVYVYKNVSLDTFPIDTDAFIDPDAEVDLTALSIEGLIAEFQQLSTLDAEISIDFLINRYGFIIPEEVEEYIPAALTAMPIEKLFSMEGVMEIADSVYVGRLLQFERVEGSEITAAGWVDSSGNEVVGLNAKIADYSLGQLLKGEINVDTLLNDITVADIFSMTSDDSLPVYLDTGDGKQLIEDKSVVIWYNSDGSRAEGIVSSLAGFTVMEISSEINNLQIANISGIEEYSGERYNPKLESDSEGDYILLTKADGIMAELADVTVIELTSGDISDELTDIRVGVVMGYTYDEVNDTWISDGQEATGIMAALANKKISELENSVDEITIADAMSLTYNETENAYYDKDGSKVTGVMAALADKQIGELNDAVNELTLSEVMGYTYDEETDSWLDEDGNKATGVMAALADKRIDELDGAVDELTIAEVMGYTYDEGTDSWLDEDGNKVTGVTAALADKRIDELDSATDELTIADVMGYTYDEETDSWLDEDGNKATGVMAALADKQIGELDGAVDELTIAEVMGYTYDDETDSWLDEDGNKVTGVTAALADKRIDELDSATDELTIADVMGYTYDEETDSWLDEDGNKATGVTAALADKRIDELDDAADELTIADVMGYTYDEETDTWLDENGEEATGVTAALADKKINEIDGAVDELTIAEVMGYTYDEETDSWLDEEGNEVSGVTAALADRRINELDSAIDELTLAEVMGYTYDETTKTWTDENDEPVTGAMAALANKQINELDSAFDELTIAEVMGYKANPDGDGYLDENDEPVKGIMAALADKTIGNLDTSVGAVKIGDIAGFKYVDNTWYEVYDAENQANSVPASGLLAAFADLTVDEMTDENKLTEKVQTVTVADALGYDLGNDGKYYNNGNLVTGIMAVIAGTQLNSIEDKVNDSYMGDMLGFTYNEEDDSWYDGDEKVHVLMQAVSRTKFNNVSSLADTLTIADLIPAENRTEGLMSLVSPTTTLDEMPNEMSRILNNTTVEDLINCNAIELDDMNDHDIEMFLHYVGDNTLPEFIMWTTDLITKPGFDAFYES